MKQFILYSWEDKKDPGTGGFDIDWADGHEVENGYNETVLGYFDTAEECAKLFDKNGFYSEFDIAVKIAKEMIDNLYLPF